jgi:signal-transduction protein with cAMP-binding, CBS, and nucleotidyltransferase domain
VINSPGHASGLREVVNKFAHIDQGDFFGEMSLIIDMPRLATVTATERSLVITVSKTNFCNFIKVVPEMGNVLRTDVQKRMMEKLYACKIPFFSGITLEKVAPHPYHLPLSQIMCQKPFHCCYVLFCQESISLSYRVHFFSFHFIFCNAFFVSRT